MKSSTSDLCFFYCCFFKFLIGVKETLLRPELWLNKSQQLCRTCSPRPTKLWPTAGLQRQLCTWKERSSRRSAGLTIPQWMTVVLVSLASILPYFLVSPHLSLTLLLLLPWINCRPDTLCTCPFYYVDIPQHSNVVVLGLACTLERVY